jgi:exoribonuclease R
MYKIVFTNQTEYEVYETNTFQKVNITPPSKIFNNDTFNSDGEIIHSPVRIDKYIPGVLDLTKTYGKDGKFLYLCKPDDKRYPFFIIPYSIPVTFIKNTKYLYITFQFINWDNDLARGSITQNLGSVEVPEHFYEYMLYCKSLNISIQSFTKDVNKALKNEDVISKIVNQYSIPLRKGNIFTIDAPGSIDLDDAISIKDNVLSVYISHVPIIMDYLNVWESFTNRISNIYLPDKKRNMLPSALAELCSLNEGCHRICLAMDINMDTREYKFGIYVVKIKHNYTYDTNLDENEDYQKIRSIFKTKTANELISKIMILFNTNSATTMKEYKDGIYKNVASHNYDFMKNQSSDYEIYNEQVNYLHITSPIRRLIDILNLYQLSKRENIFQHSENADVFYSKWFNKLDYINKCFKSIKKVQNKCKILSIFETEKHKIYKGYVYDKIIRTDNKFRYQVHIHDLNLIYDLTTIDDLTECSDYSFKLYVFHDESTLRNKVKLQLV